LQPQKRAKRSHLRVCGIVGLSHVHCSSKRVH